MSSKLLIEESPLLVQPSLAVVVGLNEAMFLQQVHYWLNPRFNKNHIEGRLWVHNTYEQWQKQFPFWGEKTIRRAISNLEKKGVLESRVTINNFKKTKFYTINYETLDAMQNCEKPNENAGSDPSGQNDQIDLPKRADGSGQNDQIERDNMTSSYKKDTETTTETTLLPPNLLLDQSSAKNKKEEEDEEDKLMSIWNEVVQSKLGGQSVSLTPKRLISVRAVFGKWFGSDREQFRSYCTQISKSKFLMGKNDSGFRARFDWALNPDNIAKILEGAIYDKPVKEIPKDVTWEEFEAQLTTTIPCPIWRAASLILAKSLSQVVYKAWFSQVSLVGIKTDVAIFKSPSRFVADYIENHFQHKLLQALWASHPHIKSIQFSFGG